MKVKYIGITNNNFTNGEIYTVISIDEEGDYILLDDYYNEISHYKSQFEII